MLVAEKPRDGKKAADVKAHMLSQMGRKKNQMAELNLADHHARKEHHRHQMLLLTHDHDDKQQQHHDEHQDDTGYPEVETDGEEKTHP